MKLYENATYYGNFSNCHYILYTYCIQYLEIHPSGLGLKQIQIDAGNKII